MSEFNLQCHIVTNLRQLQASTIKPNWYFMTTMLNIKSKMQGVFSNMLGYEKGQPDMLVFINKEYGAEAIAIELKFNKGKQNDAQKVWQSRFNDINGKYYIASSIQDIMQIIADNGGRVA